MSITAFFAAFVPVLFFSHWLQHRYERLLVRLLDRWWGIPSAIIVISGAPVTAGILAARVIL